MLGNHTLVPRATHMFTDDCATFQMTKTLCLPPWSLTAGAHELDCNELALDGASPLRLPAALLLPQFSSLLLL